MQVRMAIDVGNTKTKFGLFENREMLHSFSLLNGSLSLNNDIFESYKVSSIIISSVNSEAEEKLKLEKQFQTPLTLTYQTPLPLKIAYETPETLGKDRIAAVVGAKSIFPEHNILVIDAGTCVTYDFLTAEGVYIGGAISPGVQLRLRAMNSHTNKLPLLHWQSNVRPQSVGKSTISSMLAGAVHGLVAEMKGFISNYQEQYKTMKIVLTGGDANFFEKELKNGIFADPNLVLKGLNEILIYNGE